MSTLKNTQLHAHHTRHSTDDAGGWHDPTHRRCRGAHNLPRGSHLACSLWLPPWPMPTSCTAHGYPKYFLPPPADVVCCTCPMPLLSAYCHVTACLPLRALCVIVRATCIVRYCACCVHCALLCVLRALCVIVRAACIVRAAYIVRYCACCVYCACIAVFMSCFAFAFLLLGTPVARPR